MPISTNTTLTPIIPFSLIVDTDYGLMQLIKEKYYDKSVFTSILEESSKEEIIYFLYSRKNINPLSEFVFEEIDQDTIDSLYNEFIEKEYINILKRSNTTDFYELVKLFNNSDGAINPIILCKNELEESVINKLSKIEEINPPLSTLIGDYNDINISAYDPIYFKYYIDSIKVLDKLNGKNLYIANYEFNFMYTEENERILLPDISILLLDHNLAKTIDIYKIDEEDIPIG